MEKMKGASVRPVFENCKLNQHEKLGKIYIDAVMSTDYKILRKNRSK